MSHSNTPTKSLELTSGVQYLPGCGPERAELLAKLGVRTIRDLLFLFPRDYQDLTEISSIAKLEEGKLANVVGTIEELDGRVTQSQKHMLGVLLREGTLFMRGVWFNQSYMAEKLRPGQRVMFSGKPVFRSPRFEMVHPAVRWLGSEEETPPGSLAPIYPLTAGLSQHEVRTLTKAALDRFVSALVDVFPATFLQTNNLLPIATALSRYHFPASHAELAAARRRLVYQELLVLQLALALRRAEREKISGALQILLTPKIDARIRRLLPFALTAEQDVAVQEIAADLAHSFPMNRLLQGDVGAGKTVVAVYAMLLTIACGAQAVLMAPTEILAQQHFDTLMGLLKHSQVRIALYTGNVTGTARDSLLGKLKAGEIDILVGTQALIESDLDFAKLGLVVIDEQHRFGVRQRAQLRNSGQPHYLVMTATPIPRTVAMTQFGDLETSTLRSPLPNRQPVHTYLPPVSDWPKWWEFVRKKLREGRQAFVVVPRVEATDDENMADLASVYESLSNGELEAFKIELLHGRLSGDAKLAVMERFTSGQTQVLLATTVIEVGIDIPNATLMTIMNAERFGLAQLHQLRGRVCRGTQPGFCCLLADTQNTEAAERLGALLRTTDGFELAEIDFRLRGPGDLFGERQHGMAPLRVADLSRDSDILAQTRLDADELLRTSDELTSPEFAQLRKMALVRYGKVLSFGDVG
jgi:ATP-dependent DNA helicase RecG